jgi:hypothetical protein
MKGAVQLTVLQKLLMLLVRSETMSCKGQLNRPGNAEARLRRCGWCGRCVRRSAPSRARCRGSLINSVTGWSRCGPGCASRQRRWTYARVSTAGSQRIKDLEPENREVERANEISSETATHDSMPTLGQRLPPVSRNYSRNSIAIPLRFFGAEAVAHAVPSCEWTPQRRNERWSVRATVE